MKKVLVVLLLLPMIVNASCNKDKHQEYLKLVPNITYDNNYSMSTSSFTVSVYNIFDGMYIVYNKEKYFPDEDNTITIEKIKGGATVILNVYHSSDCPLIKTITIHEPFYNKYYNTMDCYGYEDKLTICSSQFTASEVTKEILEKSKYNYDRKINQDKEETEKPEEEKVGFFEKTREFLMNWGIKILLAFVTIVFSTSIYNTKFRKIKHGI